MATQGPGRIDLTNFQGLVSAPGLLMRAEASCLEVRNWEFPAPGVMRKRRGFGKFTSSTVAGPVWKLLTSRLMGQNMLAHVQLVTPLVADRLFYGDGTAPLSVLSTVDNGFLLRPRDIRAQMAVCNRNHYITADNGNARLESDIGIGSVRYAGMPRGGLIASSVGGVVNAVAGGALGDGFARAYRMTLHRKDADGIELGGAPTGRFVVANRSYTVGYSAASAASVTGSFGLPREFGTISTLLATDYYFRIWATKTYNEATGESGDDEMYQVIERTLTSTDVTNGFINFTDNTPDTFLSAAPTLHTNQFDFPATEANTYQGVVNEDAPPPQSNDVAYWQDVMWFGDVNPHVAVTFAMIGLPTNGDTFLVSIGTTNVTLTAKTSPTLTTDFQIVTSGPSTAINIRLTCYALLVAIRNSVLGLTTNGLDAFHVATGNTLPGLISLYARRPNLRIGFQPSNTTPWSGFGGYNFNLQLPQPSSNTLCYSKPLRADSVPPINQLAVGPKDSRILRIVPFRDSMLVFTDYGIYRVAGRTFADFSVYPFDLGYRLISRELVGMCDEKVYAWCYEGIIEIDDGGITVISAPIEPTIEQLQVSISPATNVWGPCFTALAFATAYRTKHQIRFHYPQTDASGSLNGCYRWLAWDTRTRTWTMGEFSGFDSVGYTNNRSCAVVRFTDDLLITGTWKSAGVTLLTKESQSYTSDDFYDMDDSGGTAPVDSYAEFQYQVPDHEGMVHWQNATFTFENSEVSYRPRPTSIDVFIGTENSLSVDTYAVSASQLRVEAAGAARRGQRGIVAIQHALQQYAGLIGITQAFRGGSRYRRNTTP